MRGVTHPVVKDVVLVGAGHAHVAVLRMFGMRPLPGVRFTLITREVHTPYSGMLPGLIAGRYGFDDAHIDTGPLARFAGARLYQDEVTGIDFEACRVLCAQRPAVPYDLLSLDIGSTPDSDTVPGAGEHAIPVKPIDGFLRHFEALTTRVIGRRGQARIAVVGAGAAGVELLLSVERRLRREVAAAGFDPAGLSFALVSGDAHILPTFPPAFRARFRDILAAREVAVISGAAVTMVEAGLLRLDGHEPVRADEILWTTQARPARWLERTGLPLNKSGFLAVEDTLRVRGFEHIFAAGDTIGFPARALPKSGVYAVRAGPVLADNLRRALTGKSLRRFRPQHHAMYLVSTGEPYAVGTRNGITFSGRWAWRWKDRIDRRFMRRFNAIPELARPDIRTSMRSDAEALRQISDIAVRCGGCGAKVGATVLARALGGIEPAARANAIVGLDAPDDAALIDVGAEKLSVQTVDHLPAVVDDPYLFGKIAANHALGDIFALGGEPQSALAIATVPYGPETKVEADLAAMMAGANDVLRNSHCALVGGHTREGAELSLGFAVTGMVARASVLRKGGLLPGDALILTKPIGTGTLIAAEMRGKAKARWVMGAIAHMIKSSADAAAILRRNGTRAATDVTSFGLIGHIMEMVRASGVAAEVALDRIPVLAGARETAALGIFSSLQPQNARLRGAISNLDAATKHSLYPLLFDPQTAGGLLAGVPVVRAEPCVAELQAAGYADAAIIGYAGERTQTLEPIALVVDGAALSRAPHRRDVER